jgi:hypothetical protein
MLNRLIAGAGVLLVASATAASARADPQRDARLEWLPVRAGQALPLTALRARCFDFQEVAPTDVRDCAVSDFGELGRVDGRTYYYAVYCVIPLFAPQDSGACGDNSFSATYYRERGTAIFESVPASNTALLIFDRVSWDIGMYRYRTPAIVPNAAGQLLYIPIAWDGTGHGNGSEYYLRRNGKWEQVESTAWEADLRRRVPSDRQMLQGMWPDVRTLRVEVGLYRDGDGNCCPTGGRMKAQLAIRSMRFVVQSVVIERAR